MKNHGKKNDKSLKPKADKNAEIGTETLVLNTDGGRMPDPKAKNHVKQDDARTAFEGKH